jgi:hypothetical protein
MTNETSTVLPTTRAGRAGLGALIGLGTFGVFMLLMKRRRAPRSRAPRTPREASFLGQALRSVVLSVLGVIATRLAQRLPLPAARSNGVPAE